MIASIRIGYRSGRYELFTILLNTTDQEDDVNPTMDELHDIVEAPFEEGSEGFLTIYHGAEISRRTTIRLKEVESITVERGPSTIQRIPDNGEEA